MGYIFDAFTSEFVSPRLVSNTAGTWSYAFAGSVWSRSRAAAAASWVSRIPLSLLCTAVSSKGSYLKSIDLWYNIVTEQMAAIAAELIKMTLPSTNVIPTAAVIATTYDADHDTADERRSLAQHKLTLTVTAPAWTGGAELFYVELSGTGGASGVFDFYGARANFELRL